MVSADEENILNALALAELNKTAKALVGQLEQVPKHFSQITGELKKYSSEIAKIQSGSKYTELSDEDRNNIIQMNTQINALYGELREEFKRIKKDSKKGGGNYYLQQATDAVLKIKNTTMMTQSALVSYARASREKPVEIKVDARMGTTNKDVYADSRSRDKEYRELSQRAVDLGRKLAQPVIPKTQENLAAPAETGKEGSATSAMGIIQGAAAVFSGFGNGLASFNNSIAKFAGAAGIAYATMMKGIGDMLDDPFSAMLSVMSGLNQTIVSALDTFASIFDTISSAFDSIASAFSGGGGKGKGKGASIAGVVASIVTTILNVISSIINVAMQSIQAGFQIFASTLQAIFKLVKKIAFSSPIIKAILELLNLAFTLFFMPFMNSFALVLLPYVLDLLDWAMTNGPKYAELGEKLGQSLLDMVSGDDNLLENITNLATQFISEFIPQFLSLVPGLINFATKFVSNILDNSKTIIEFLQIGLKAFSEMMKGGEDGILGEFLKFGKDVMIWLANNAPDLVTFISAIMKAMLGIANFFAGLIGSDKLSDEEYSIQDLEKSSSDLVEKLGDVKEKYGITDNINAPKAALGGKFPGPFNRGIPVIAGEAGEGEYRLSESELKEIGKDTTVTIQYNSAILTSQDFASVVRKTLTDVSQKSYYR